jgi:hypothetical protein
MYQMEFRVLKSFYFFVFFIFNLTSCSSVKNETDLQITKIELIQAGLYKNNKVVTNTVGPGKSKLTTSNPGLLLSQKLKVQPSLGESIGFYFRFIDSKTKIKKLTTVVEYPKGGIYNKDKNTQVFFEIIKQKYNTSNIYAHMFRFGKSWELIGGTYKLSIMDGENELVTKEFFVVASE